MTELAATIPEGASPGGERVCQQCGTHPLPATARACHNCGGARLVAIVNDARPGPGVRIGDRYILLEHLGRGGFGAVFRAIHRTLGRIVAIKVLHVDGGEQPQLLKRFYGEAKNSARLSHPHNTKVFDFGHTEHGVAYLAMDLIDGKPLSALPRPLPPARVVRLADQVAGAVSEAHDIGLVHRDLKPPNIMVSDVDGDDFARVLDYGISKLVDSSTDLTQVGGFIGSPDYAAPEQVVGSGDGPDPRTDIYALGVVLFELLAGAPPFQADDPLHVLYMHRHEPPPRVLDRVQVSRELDELVARCLEKEPDKRHASMNALRNALRSTPEFGGSNVSGVTPWSGATEEATLGETPTTLDDPDEVPPRRRGPLVAALLAMGAVGAIGVALVFSSGAFETPETPEPLETPQGAAAEADDNAEPAPTEPTPEARVEAPAAESIATTVRDAIALGSATPDVARGVAAAVAAEQRQPRARPAPVRTERPRSPEPAARAPAPRPEPDPEPPAPEPSVAAPAPEPDPAPEPVDPRQLLLERTRGGS